ncbi:DUF3108 domain-containing protein [uncultured Rhodospira sp.]|uniref:DUF3108 domain-containing protein n=1 Tax=uncultured Rhodospira sp. TaxID=1936189 RepID=UPI002627AC1D|nr:DUF3108 domain-containing protein [uncultured Rhodospira sp.]
MAARVFAALMAALVAVAPPAPASAAAPREQHLLYQARFLGLPVGDVAVRIVETADRYQVTLNARATGLFWAFRGIRAHRAANGRITEDGSLEPAAYRRAYREWDKQGEVRVAYDRPDGIPKGFKNGEPVDRMEPDLRAGTLDPLSALMSVRRRVATLSDQGSADPAEMVVPVFDGKLRYDAHIRVAPPETITAAGQPWRARVVTVRFEPLGGFSENHAAEWREGGLRIAVTDHDLAIPLRIEVDQGWGLFDLVYVGRCGVVETPCPDNEVDPLEHPKP